MKKDKIFKEEGFFCTPFGPPRSAGVYAICVISTEYALPPDLRVPRVVYIGSSFNMHERVSSVRHPYRRLFNLLKNYYVCGFYNQTSFGHIDLERQLIRKYKPRFNKMHK